MNKNFDYDHAKQIIREGIEKKITFAKLREKLPEWRKRQLMSLVFDVMEEKGIKTVPFSGMVLRPRLTRKPLEISSAGNLSVMDLLKEKGFHPENCLAYPNIGNRKITITIKPAIIPENRDQEIYG